MPALRPQEDEVAGQHTTNPQHEEFQEIVCDRWFKQEKARHLTEQTEQGPTQKLESPVIRLERVSHLRFLLLFAGAEFRYYCQRVRCGKSPDKRSNSQSNGE